MTTSWFQIDDADAIPSPALLIYPDRIRSNIERMLEIAGHPDRLRPHVKTHKMAELVAMQQAGRIERFKCATLAEAELVATCQARDILWAYQPVGPNIQRLKKLVSRFPQVRFSVLVDNPETVAMLEAADLAVGVLVDLDCGMHRSGIAPSSDAIALYRRIANSRLLSPQGLHVYDGHIKELDPARRQALVDECFAPVEAFRAELVAQGLAVPQLVAGGSPTFAIHARHPDRQLSPGTTLLWDAAYRTKFPELDFLLAAALLTRVISKPKADILCLDLGYKAVSPDNPNPRAYFPDLPDARLLVHSEEHMAIQTARADRHSIGACLYAIPWHICPTVALYPEAIVIRQGRACERWKIAARDRMLTL